MIEKCWVIKNKDGYYVNPNFGALFTGITTGFVGFNNKEIAEQYLEPLDEEYYCEEVNFKNIPKGERVYIVNI